MATIKWTNDELEVFSKLGIGEENVSLRKLIRGQREINGRLYHAINLILDSLPQPQPGTRERKGNSKVAQARKINGGVPGPPPGCNRQ